MSQEMDILYFMDKFDNKSNEELFGIIKNHFDYQLDAVKAAVMILRQRGCISAEEKDDKLADLEEKRKKEDECKKTVSNKNISQERDVSSYIGQFKGRSTDDLGKILANPSNYPLNAIKGVIEILWQRGYYSDKEKEELLAYHEEIKQKEEEHKNAESNKSVGIGIIMLIIGVIVSLVSFLAAAPGGTYIITVGLIAVGIREIIKGWK